MPPVSAFFIPASTFVSRPEHGIEAARRVLTSAAYNRGASRLHWLGTRAAAVVSRDDGTGSLRKKPELRASIIVINQVKTSYLWALYMP